MSRSFLVAISMARYRRANVAGESYFFTMLTERRLAILTDPAIRTALRAAIETVRAKRSFRIDDWVLLPDHLHTIWALPDGDADFSTRLRLIKSPVARYVCRGYVPHTICI